MGQGLWWIRSLRFVCDAHTGTSSLPVHSVAVGWCRSACRAPFCRSAHILNEPSARAGQRSEEHTSELQSLTNLVCRLLLEKKKLITCISIALQYIQLPY